jgi:hypothetical protein
VCKIFIDAIPTIQVVGGLVHVIKTDGECEVWPMGIFAAFMASGTRTVREFQALITKPASLAAARKRRPLPLRVQGEEV